MFNIVEGKVIIDPEMLPIPEFKQIWDRDKSKAKDTAYKELSYVYFIADLKSPYSGYLIEERADKVRDDFIRDKEWTPDELIADAINKYEELQLAASPVYRLYLSFKTTLAKLHKYFNDVDFASGEYNPENVLKIMASLDKVLISLEKVEAKIKKDESDNHIRGGGRVRSREL